MGWSYYVNSTEELRSSVFLLPEGFDVVPQNGERGWGAGGLCGGGLKRKCPDPYANDSCHEHYHNGNSDCLPRWLGLIAQIF